MILNPEHLDAKIIYYKKVIQNPEKVIDYFESIDTGKWNDWFATGTNGVRHGYSKSVGFDDSFNSFQLSLISNEIKNAIESATYHYMSNVQVKPVKIPHFFDIKKYTDGADMGMHADSEDESDKVHPIISAVLYLNDNYSGGELEFIRQNLKIKPEAGSLIMFPSFPPYYHRPAPVTSGVKYMVPFFLYEDRMI